MLKCGECGANLIIGTGGGTHIHKKYVCANYFNRGTCGNDLYIRRDILEEGLLGRLQRELLRSEVIDYTVAEFGRQLRAALSSMSNDLGVLRRRKEQLEGEIERFADAIARGGPLDALVPQIAVREKELRLSPTVCSRRALLQLKASSTSFASSSRKASPICAHS